MTQDCTTSFILLIVNVLYDTVSNAIDELEQCGHLCKFLLIIVIKTHCAFSPLVLKETY
jgi:hypothetical protein